MCVNNFHWEALASVSRVYQCIACLLVQEALLHWSCMHCCHDSITFVKQQECNWRKRWSSVNAIIAGTEKRRTLFKSCITTYDTYGRHAGSSMILTCVNNFHHGALAFASKVNQRIACLLVQEALLHWSCMHCCHDSITLVKQQALRSAALCLRVASQHNMEVGRHAGSSIILAFASKSTSALLACWSKRHCSN